MTLPSRLVLAAAKGSGPQSAKESRRSQPEKKGLSAGILLILAFKALECASVFLSATNACRPGQPELVRAHRQAKLTRTGRPRNDLICCSDSAYIKVWCSVTLCRPSFTQLKHGRLSEGIALGALTLAHHLTEGHSPDVEEGPGDGKEGQGQHGKDTDIEALIILVRSTNRPSRSRHGGSCQRCAQNCCLLLLLQGCLSSLWGCHE